MCRYSGISFSAAPALHTASDTPRIALAPNLAVGRTKEELGSTSCPAGALASPASGSASLWQCPPAPARQPPVLFTSKGKKGEGITFVLRAVHLKHQIVYLLLIHDREALRERNAPEKGRLSRAVGSAV